MNHVSLKTDIEIFVAQNLEQQIGADRAESLFALYAHSLNQLRTDIWPSIRGVEPNLTEHGEPHIRDVLTNASIITNDSDVPALDRFVLALMILFHDVGNLDGRNDHNKKIADFYDDVNPPKSSDSQLRQMVLRGCRAHCGFAADGSKDTLADIGQSPQPLMYHRVRLQDMAAVLRFADEMSEDPRRTSRYMFNQNRYSIESKIHHWYAKVTSPCIDPPNGRVALNYAIPVCDIGIPGSPTFSDELEHKLGYLYHRIAKLDTERRYTGFYSPLIARLKRTEFSVEFVHGGYTFQCSDKPFVLDDLVTPDSQFKPLKERYPELETSYVFENLNKGLSDAKED